MKETSFKTKLREVPMVLNIEEFDKKLITKHLNIESYDLLIDNNLVRNELMEIFIPQPEIALAKDVILLDCNLTGCDTRRIYIRYAKAFIS